MYYVQNIEYNKSEISVFGNVSLLNMRQTAFLCSSGYDRVVMQDIMLWAEDFDDEGCLMCGNLMPIEEIVMDIMLRKRVPVVLVLAVTLSVPNTFFYTPAMNQAVMEGRLLIVSPFSEAHLTKPYARTAADRNRWMLTNAQHVMVGYLSPNGRLAHQIMSYEKVSMLHQYEIAEIPMTKERREMLSEEMKGWNMCSRIEDTDLTSAQFRSVLRQYLELRNQRPSFLHSSILYITLKKYSRLPDFDFTVFFRMWDYRNIEPCDWRYKKGKNGRWQRPFVEALLIRLCNTLRYDKVIRAVNIHEKPDANMIRYFLDKLLRRNPSKYCLVYCAYRLARYENNHEAIEKYGTMLKKSAM